MSDVSVTVAARSVELGRGHSSVTASVTNESGGPQRIVLGAYGVVRAPASGSVGPTAPPADPAAWTTIERPLREIPAGGTEQFVASIASAAAPVGTYELKFIAFPADRAPEDYADHGQVVQVVVPETGPAPPPPKKRPWLFIVLAVAVLLLIGAVAFALTRGGSVIVPNVVGQPSADAELALRRAGLDVAIASEIGPEPLGVVVRQDPIANAEIPAGSAVTLVVRGGMFVPDVTGLSVEAALAKFADSGISTSQEGEVSDAAPGTVVRTEPPPGTEIGEGGSVLVVVAEARTIAVPNLVNRDLTSATRTLAALGLGSQATRGPLCTGFLPCIVARQDPQPGAQVRPGTVVTLTTI